MDALPSFYTKHGHELPGLPLAASKRMRERLTGEFGISPIQICETAAFSFAMVVRYALGLSAEGGKVCVLVNDSLAGWIALTTARHLVNAGSEAHVLFLMDPEVHGAEMPQVLRPLELMGVTLDHWSMYSDPSALTELVESCHNVLCGLYRPGTPGDEVTERFVGVLNELQTPVHAVDAPLGVDVDTGKAAGTPLYASSTLSLGIPYGGLKAGAEFAGRHYLCDISYAQAIYEAEGAPALGPLFAEQPVTQIFPEAPKQATT